MIIYHHANEKLNNQQLFYKSINTLGLMKLKTLKRYIKNNELKNFIRPYKFFVKACIIFIKKTR